MKRRDFLRALSLVAMGGPVVSGKPEVKPAMPIATKHVLTINGWRAYRSGRGFIHNGTIVKLGPGVKYMAAPIYAEKV